MAEVTYYVALPILRDDDGMHMAGEALELRSLSEAERSAKSLAAKHGGAVAFSRSGDPAIGEFRDAIILARIGDVPADLESFTGG